VSRLLAVGWRAITNPILRSNFVFFLSAGAMGITNYLLSTMLARRLPPGDFSQIGVTLNIIAPLQPLAAAIGVAIVRSATENRVLGTREITDAIQRTLLRGIIVIHLVLSIAMLVLHEQVSAFFRLTHPSLPYLALTISAVAFCFGLFQAALQERGQYGRLSLLYFSESVFRLVGGFLVITLGFGVPAVIVIYLVSAVLILIPLPRPNSLWNGMQVNWERLRPVMRDIGALTLSNLGIALLISIDVALCRTFLDPITADRYVALAAVAKFFLSMTGWAGAIAFRHLVEARQQGEGGTRAIVLSFGTIIGLGIPFIALCAVGGPAIIGFAFGAPFRASGEVLWITAVSAVAVSLLQLVIAYFNAVQWRWYLPVFILGSACTVAALPLVGHNLHGYAVVYAVGTTALVLVLFALMIVHINRDADTETRSSTSVPLTEARNF